MSRTTTGTFDPARALRATAWFVAVGVAASGLKASTGVVFGCPWRALTGTRCPFCGATTMGTRLLVGDLSGAWQANPFVLLFLIGMGPVVIAWIIEARGGPALRLPGVLGRSAAWWTGIGIAAVAFALWRNLV